MAPDRGIRLELSTGRLLTTLDAITDSLKACGFVIAPLNRLDAQDEIRHLLEQPTLTQAETEQLKAHFLLPRERLFEIISATGRKANVPDGGELTTFDATHQLLLPAALDCTAGCGLQSVRPFRCEHRGRWHRGQ